MVSARFAAAVLGALLTNALPAVAAAAGEPVLPSATGKIPIEGSLAANDLTPSVGGLIYVYFNVTPLVAVPNLELRLRLSASLVPVAGARSLVRSFGSVGPGQTVVLVTPVRIAETGDQTVTASAQLVDTRELALSRPFLLTLNPSPAPGPRAETGTNSKGEKLIIYGEDPAVTPSPHPPQDRR